MSRRKPNAGLIAVLILLAAFWLAVTLVAIRLGDLLQPLPQPIRGAAW